MVLLEQSSQLNILLSSQRENKLTPPFNTKNFYLLYFCQLSQAETSHRTAEDFHLLSCLKLCEEKVSIWSVCVSACVFSGVAHASFLTGAAHLTNMGEYSMYVSKISKYTLKACFVLFVECKTMHFRHMPFNNNPWTVSQPPWPTFRFSLLADVKMEHSLRRSVVRKSILTLNSEENTLYDSQQDKCHDTEIMCS